MWHSPTRAAADGCSITDGRNGILTTCAGAWVGMPKSVAACAGLLASSLRTSAPSRQRSGVLPAAFQVAGEALDVSMAEAEQAQVVDVVLGGVLAQVPARRPGGSAGCSRVRSRGARPLVPDEP
jgi:hypothetical protein